MRQSRPDTKGKTEYFIGACEWSIEDVVDASRSATKISLSENPSWRKLIEQGREFLGQCLASGTNVYGVTTGYGDSCDRQVPAQLVDELPHQLVRYHGCGLGKALDRSAVRATIIARLVCLARGYSGVRMNVLSALVDLLNLDIVPIVPEEGSVGASGDLTPLSYIAAALIGERDVLCRGCHMSAALALKESGLEPITLQSKEALALMNGTSMMTGLSCLAFDRARYLGRLVSAVSGMAVVAIGGNTTHFEARLFALKPHPGQLAVAAWIREAIGWKASSREASNIQDPYSLRCAPHVIGVLVDMLPALRSMIEIELNSANDNPLIDPEEQRVLHGGHFYGGHLAFAMDSLKTLIANIGDLLDRQLALLVNRSTNRGLPANLTGAGKDRIAINHGFKAVQIAVSAWCAEALKLTLPASIFSRSTECHNQDKVSMGAIAARECHRILELTEQIAAAHLMAVIQAIRLRLSFKELSESDLSETTRYMLEMVADKFHSLGEDRSLDVTISDIVRVIREQKIVFLDAGGGQS